MMPTSISQYNQKRLDNLQTLMLDGELDAEYRKIKTKLEPEIERLASKISQLGKNDNNEREIIDFGFYFLRNMSKLFTSASLGKTVYPRFDLP